MGLVCTYFISLTCTPSWSDIIFTPFFESFLMYSVRLSLLNTRSLEGSSVSSG